MGNIRPGDIDEIATSLIDPVQVPQTLHFEPSLDALRLRSDVMSLTEIFSLHRR